MLLCVTCLVAAFAYWAIGSFQPLQNRFQRGDVVAIADGRFHVNVSGREKYWRAAWDSFAEKPLFGHGAGSSQRLISQRFGNTTGHPHNDYLRLLHDFGLVGTALWAGGIGSVMLALARGRQRSRQYQAVTRCAGLALFALLATMLTDNTLVYLFFMAPLGIILGLAFGSGASPLPSVPPSSRRAQPD